MVTGRSLVVIPARLESARLPRKVLADIGGWPMIRHVYTRAQQARLPSDVLVATDSDEVAEIVKSWGGKAVMTSPHCTCGTERIASIVDQLDADIVVNVQGDEPLVDPRLIDQLIEVTAQTGAEVVVPVRKITDLGTLKSLSAVKAVLKQDGTVIYMSRAAVPVIRDVAPDQWLAHQDYWLVVGTASYRKEALIEYRHWEEATLERLEKIEQLRFLEAGKRVLAVQTKFESVAVDLPEDLELVRQLVRDMPHSREGDGG